MKIKNLYQPSLAMAFTIIACASCNDWDEHYDASGDSGVANETLYEQISARPDLSDFKELAEAVHVFSNYRKTDLSYADVLNGDQFYTVWAPKNGTFNKDSLIALCQTSEGDSLVDTHFMRNHIARYRHSVTANSEKVMMLNTKTLDLNASKMNDIQISEKNVVSKNGILHVVDGTLDYEYNIYEGLFSLDAFKHVGSFLYSYQTEEFDEKNSLAMGIEDGKTVYIDSVFIDHNILLNRLDYINSEDSSFLMLVPTRELWDSLYAEAATYYNYAFIEKADSIFNYWSHYALLQDLIYNPGWQSSIQDSIWSTTYNKRTPKYHSYYKPFAQGGIFSNIKDSLRCSNGSIYTIDTWPFDKTHTYFLPITTEAEGKIYEDYESATKSLTLNRRYVSADSVSSNAYLDVVPNSASSAYYLTYEISDVLSGEYDVCLVMLPKTVFNKDYTPEKDSRQFRPCKFTAQLDYTGTNGMEYSLKTTAKYIIDENSPSYYVESTDASADYIFECDYTPTTKSTRAFTSNPYCVDTIKLATVKFPTCNYARQKVTNRLKITNSIRSNQTNAYNAEMFIDCIYLKPHID